MKRPRTARVAFELCKPSEGPQKWRLLETGVLALATITSLRQTVPSDSATTTRLRRGWFASTDGATLMWLDGRPAPPSRKTC